MSKTIDLNKYSEQFKAIAYCPVPACTCGLCEDGEEWGEPATYECEGCKRSVFFCYGADDHLSDGTSLFDHCDDCANVITKDREDDSWKDAAKAVAKTFGVSNEM